VNYLTKKICHRFGWVSDQASLGQLIAGPQDVWRRCKSLLGYGAYFDLEGRGSDAFCDHLDDAVERWNGTVPTELWLRRSGSEGRVLGEATWTFVHFVAARQPIQQRTDASMLGPDLRHFTEYQPDATQAAALGRFVTSVAISNRKYRLGAFQASYATA